MFVWQSENRHSVSTRSNSRRGSALCSEIRTDESDAKQKPERSPIAEQIESPHKSLEADDAENGPWLKKKGFKKAELDSSMAQEIKGWNSAYREKLRMMRDVKRFTVEDVKLRGHL